MRAYRGLLIGIALLLLWVVRPIGVEAPRAVDTEFDTARAIARLEFILGDQKPHPTGTDANDAVLARLEQQVRGLGFTPEVSERFHCNDWRAGAAVCASPRNLMFWVTAPGPDAVMVTAHHDSVPAGPGAADDGMGVAVALEVAHLLKGRKLERPVLVLITDAEEAGLVGAAAFAAHHPLAKQIGAVVNLEARGTTGIASMFQTSTPNGNDVAALQRGGFVPAANMLSTDLFKQLPNDTDLTVLLPLGVDAANYAIIGGGKRYHTPIDDLAHLDRNSVRHMGASALSATLGFAAAAPQVPERSRVFADFALMRFLVLPQWLAGVLVGLGLVASAMLFWRTKDGHAVRTGLAPLLALVAGVLIAVAAGMVVAAIRPESDYGTAWPIALRTAYAAGALLGALGIVRLLNVENGVRLAAATWVLLGLLVAGGFAFMPGLSTFYAWPVVPLVLAALASFVPLLRRAVPWLMALAALLFLVLALPLGGGLEDALFVEYAAPTTLFLIFMLLFWMPVRGAHKTQDVRGGRWTLPVFGVALVAATVAALLVSAYSRDAPRHLSIVHEDVDGAGAFRISDNGPLPPAMLAAARFRDDPEEGKWVAPAPRLADVGKLTQVSDTVSGGVRTVRFVAEAPVADRQLFEINKGDGVRALTVNGSRSEMRAPLTLLSCTGRACRTLDVTLELKAGALLPEMRWTRSSYGAGPAAEALVAARPDTAMAVHGGDRNAVIRDVRLD
ncbi:M20/M25/M40 family metallo-hydrolase [Sandaracinobacteroides hominis]|uniref:M20/M25/M40 family metallo-hydrolase n=1 Tax=Sandaracinobacteroides hominis TaxID=2780086 RepID=UPI0018F5A68A|nr:M20/M25/M40 family metallo-hydrolase [Sandaracinobacteroides hominis]